MAENGYTGRAESAASTSGSATARVEATFSALFEREVAVFFVATGGAANALALSQFVPPWGMILCHQESHIQMDECGAPEFFTGGARLLAVEGPDVRMDPGTLDARVRETTHAGKPAAISVSQATEAGTVYSLESLRKLTEVARRHALGRRRRADHGICDLGVDLVLAVIRGR